MGVDEVMAQIRRAIEVSSVSRYRIAKDIGLSQATLSRVMSGQRSLSVEALEQLADYLGLEIVIRPKSESHKGRKG